MLQQKWENSERSYKKLKILYDECEYANDTSKIIIDSNHSEMGGLKHQLHIYKESAERLEKEK